MKARGSKRGFDSNVLIDVVASALRIPPSLHLSLFTLHLCSPDERPPQNSKSTVEFYIHQSNQPNTPDHQWLLFMSIAIARL